MPTELAAATVRVIDRITRSASMGKRLMPQMLLAVFGLLMLAPTPAPAQPVQWTQRAVSGPAPRFRHAMAYDAPRGVTVLFGGSNGFRQSDTWEWNGTVWTQRAVSGPSPRDYHAMAYDAARAVTVLFGGFTDSNVNGETWTWNGTAWSQLLVSGPSPRWGHSMGYDASRGVTVLFGGIKSNGSYSAETWEWDGTAWTQRVVSGPAPRAYLAMAHDASRGVTVLFGGYDGSAANGETWEWNGSDWTQRTVTGPSPRNHHAMAYDAARGVAVLFGGFNIAGYNGETWEWNGAAWTQRVANGPSARREHAMAYDAARGVIVLFGGATSDGIYSGETWDLGVPCVAPSISTQPVAQTACLGGSASFTVTAGGAPNSYQWRKSGANLADEPNHISGAHAAMLLIVNITPADAGSGMGGYDCIVENPCGSATSNTAALTVNVAPSITQQPTGQSILSGGTATFTVAASAPPAGGALAYQWRRNGVALADGPFGNGSVVHGAATPFLALTSVALADNTAAFDCIVTNTCGSTTSFPAGLSVMSSCTADFNHDGIVNSQDFFDFVAAFFAGCGH